MHETHSPPNPHGYGSHRNRVVGVAASLRAGNLARSTAVGNYTPFLRILAPAGLCCFLRDLFSLLGAQLSRTCLPAFQTP